MCSNVNKYNVLINVTDKVVSQLYSEKMLLFYSKLIIIHDTSDTNKIRPSNYCFSSSVTSAL